MMGDFMAPGLAALIASDVRATHVESAATVDETVSALVGQRFDLHVIGIGCLEMFRDIGRRHLRDGLEMFVPDERVLVDPLRSPMSVMEARRLGFARVIDPRTDLVERLLAEPGSKLWWVNHVDNFSIGDTARVTMSDICRDDIDRQIITLIVEGFSDAEIAEKLMYAVQSVRNRISRILQEGGFRNRTDLAVSMVRRR